MPLRKINSGRSRVMAHPLVTLVQIRKKVCSSGPINEEKHAVHSSWSWEDSTALKRIAISNI